MSSAILGKRNMLLAGVCTSTLAFSLGSQASADEYTVSNEAQLRAAVLSANANPDATATIILAGDILMSSTVSLNPPSKPITIDTQGFTLTGNIGSGTGVLFLTDSGASDPVTLEGNFVGGNAAAGSAGSGLITRTGVSAINNGVIVGGNSLNADGGSGVQLGTTGVGSTSFVNNGTIRGGDGPTNGVNANGAGIQVRVPTIMPLINNGTVEGGVGAAAIIVRPGTASLNLINSGTISAGAGQVDAIRWMTGATTGTLSLELQSGSVINGNVVANATATTDTLRLGGAANDTFDVSAIGPQYQNFDTFQKTGASTWFLTGTGTATTDWDIQAGTLAIGSGGTSGSIIGDVTLSGGILGFNRSDSMIFAGTISGFGAVNQIGSGTTVLTGSNTYSGGTFLNAGTLSVASDGNLGDASGALNFDGGALQVTGTGFTGTNRTINWGANGGGFGIAEAANTFKLAQDIAGGGPLAKTGAGTLVLTGSNSYSGGTTISAGTLQLGNGGTSGSIAGNIVNDSVLTFNRSDVFVVPGVISGTGLVEQSGPGTTVLSADSTYTGGTRISDGTLQIGNGGTSGSIVGFVGNDGTLAFNRSDSMVFDGVILGTGTIRQIGSGLTDLSGDSIGFVGSTSVDAGTLAVNGSLCGDLTVMSGAKLQGNGVVCDTTNAGTVAPGNSIGTLTINGNYIGNDGTLEMETELGGDASPTDRLVVTGDTSGSSNVKVINTGGTGAATVEGIKIVDIGGASNGTFSLLGDYVINGEQAVVAGAYGYTLQKNGVSTPSDGDWYLRSELTPTPPGTSPTAPPSGPIYQPGAPLYEAYAQVLQSLNGVSSLQQRVGNRYWVGAGNSALAQGDGPGTVEAAPMPSEGGDTVTDARGIWARIDGAHGKFEPRTSTTDADYDIDTWKLTSGIDGQFYESDAGKLIGSLTAHYGHASADISSFFGDGSIDTDGYGLGGTLTWYGENGFYVDGQAQATWYDSDLTSDTLGTSLTDGNNGFGYAFSLETGKRINLDQSWTLTPQAQLAYSNVDIDNFTDPFGAEVSFGSGDSLKGRVGLSADYQNAWEDGAGKLTRTNLYGIANLYYEFLDGNETDVSGVNFATANDRTWGGVGAGGSYNWNDDKYSLYSEVSINTSLSNFADSYSLNGTAGFRVKF